MSEERTARHLLVTFRTAPEDLAALKTLARYVDYVEALEHGGSGVYQAVAKEDIAHLKRCYKRLEEMLAAGASPMIEDAEKVLAGMSKRLREKEDEIMDLLSEVELLRDRGKEASRKLHEIARKLSSVGTEIPVKSLCESAWMLGEIAALLDKGT